ncbi:glucose dehydrogenase [Bradyrhizobium sp. i1.3.1]
MSNVSRTKAGVLGTVSTVVGIGIMAGLLGSAAVASDETSEKRLLNATQETSNWLHHHRDYTAQRYSPLNQINRNTVKGLHVAWTMALGGIEGGGIWSHGGLEGTPIVENGFMYVTDGWGSVYKIDLHGGNGNLIWKMDPKTDHDWAGAIACCGVNNRGAALWGNFVISHTPSMGDWLRPIRRTAKSLGSAM